MTKIRSVISYMLAAMIAMPASAGEDHIFQSYAFSPYQPLPTTIVDGHGAFGAMIKIRRPEALPPVFGDTVLVRSTADNIVCRYEGHASYDLNTDATNFENDLLEIIVLGRRAGFVFDELSTGSKINDVMDISNLLNRNPSLRLFTNSLIERNLESGDAVRTGKAFQDQQASGREIMPYQFDAEINKSGSLVEVKMTATLQNFNQCG